MIGCGVKFCSFYISPEDRQDLPSEDSQNPQPADFDAYREVFSKTLGFFCAVVENGCLFNPDDSSVHLDSCFEDGTEDSSSEDGTKCSSFEDKADAIDLENSPATAAYQILLDGRSPLKTRMHCSGKMILRRDKFGQPFIQ